MVIQSPSRQAAAVNKYHRMVRSFDFTLQSLLRTHYAFFALTCFVVSIRVAIHVAKRRSLELQDVFVYVSYAIFIGMWSCYVISVPKLYRLVHVSMGKMEPYPTILQDAGSSARLIWAAQWGIATFIFLAWIGCIISSALTCSSMHEFSFTSACTGVDYNRRSVTSFIYAYVVDVVTDLMGTHQACAVPLARHEPGLTSHSSSHGPSTIAVACGPTFAQLIRKSKNATRPSYNSQGYIKQAADKDQINLDNIRKPLYRSEIVGREASWEEERNSSQMGLASGARDITVTTTVHVSSGSATPRLSPT
ncbi:hypothetical protein BU23DRAFT_594356 [Bimuria novae-zelandiae CBS 107.79]|uniref:Uncharacterized protein n=1 Tax=Bimuria novae-zelandiae CBS 107.79 TaxID=1447943 RepID=A0A6A5VRW4_9PLEO|nr:hypothetical protein BU23DRAFT_594356 [Bimuria novae-zelandiae CBS 107.79]